MVVRAVLRAFVFGALLSVLIGVPSAAHAARPPADSLLAFVAKRPELKRRDKARWKRAVKRRFGGIALESGKDRPEHEVAQRVLLAAIETNIKPKRGAMAAWEAWHDTLRYVPPPIAVHYQILGFQGTKPRGRAIDLAFHFADYYTPEIAPELVAWWQAALDSGRLPDDQIKEVKEALAATRDQMRPALIDKLRLLAALAKEQQTSAAVRKAEIERDKEELEIELYRSFAKVARRPEVLDNTRRPYDRLRLQLEDMGQTLSAEDRLLDPDRPPPEPKDAPAPPLPPVAASTVGPDLTEPTEAPLPMLPAQPRPGGPPKVRDPLGRSNTELAQAYRARVLAEIEPWMGTPYRYGNATRAVGTDCSGFVQSIFQSAFGVDLPRVSRDQARRGESVRRGALRPGDLVFFDMSRSGVPDHVGIYLGKKRFVHASRRAGVTESKLDSRAYKPHYRGARRLLSYPR